MFLARSLKPRWVTSAMLGDAVFFVRIQIKQEEDNRLVSFYGANNYTSQICFNAKFSGGPGMAGTTDAVI